MRRKVVYSIIIIMLALTGCTIGGSFYMLNFSLTPNAKILSKDADSYPFMYKNYPFLRPWVDSLRQVDALKDTFIINPHGIQLHAYYVAAPQPTSKTAVIVHGYTDNAIRMFMIGYLYNRDLGYNILLPDLQHQGESEGPAIQMGWKDRLDVLQWMNIANEIFGDSTQMVVHGISMVCGGLRLYQRMGRILTRVENKFSSSSFSTHVHHKLALRKEIWMEFQRSFFTETGSQITTSDAVYSRGQRHVCAYLDGIPALRSQTGAQRTMDCAGSRSCCFIPRE